MEKRWEKFNSYELEIARNASISRVAVCLGYTPRRLTSVWTTLEEHDSVIIKNDRSYSRNSITGINGKKEGGTAIDFVKNFTGETDLVRIVQMLCELEGYSRSLDKEGKARVYQAVYERSSRQETANQENKNCGKVKLPPRADDYKVLYAYLIKTRKLAQNTVDFFVRNHYIYESKETCIRKTADGAIKESICHNIIFLGKNKNGEVCFAAKRGTMDHYGIRYRGNVAGSDLSYGFQINAAESNRVYVFEAAIDLMSYCELTGDFDQTNKLALSTVSDGALLRFLKENEQITEIVFALDQDYAGLKAACLLICKYSGYQIRIENIEETDLPEVCQNGKHTIVMKLHTDEAVNKKKELKQSDRKILLSMAEALKNLKPLKKYKVSCEFSAYGKDFNESLIYQKVQASEIRTKQRD